MQACGTLAASIEPNSALCTMTISVGARQRMTSSSSMHIHDLT